MEIQSKKQLIDLLHTPLNSKDEKKLKKLFSLSRRNYFKVVLEDNFLCISYENEHIKAWNKISLNNIQSKNKKRKNHSSTSKLISSRVRTNSSF